MSNGTKSTVGLPLRRDNHAPETDIDSPESHRHFSANKAQRSNISYITVIYFPFI